MKVPCAVPMCSDMCPGGYAKDQNGCQTCACKEDKPGKLQIPASVQILFDYSCTVYNDICYRSPVGNTIT